MTQIPEARWGSSDSTLARLVVRFGATALGSWTIRTLMPLDRKLLVRSNGRFTLLGPIGAPVLLLETTGRKSGQTRVSPLLFARDADSIVVVGSNFGQQHHPAWTGNLIKNPRATVVHGGQTMLVDAQFLSDEEKAEVWPRLTKVWPTYDHYTTKTDRNLRVFRLTRSS